MSVPNNGGTSRRAPPPWAHLCALAVLVAASLSFLDDYGVSTDESTQRRLGRLSVDYVLGISDTLLTVKDASHGTAFEAPLYVAERALGLQDPRHIHLFRHLLTHLFFLIGGVFCYLLTHRLFGSRLLAALALLVFVLHPRLYAHSFFNSKDVPFLAMFMVALFLLHRAFLHRTVGAFVLCGAAVGVLAGIRMPGVMLLVAVPALCAIDLVADRVQGRHAKKGGLLAASAFVAVGLFVLFATSPYLWGDPLGRIVASLDRFADFVEHDYGESELFQGEWFVATDLPVRYFLTWFTITTPPATLLLGVVGACVVAGRSLARPREALCDPHLRFGVVLLACFALPAIAVVMLGATLYNGWRHLYFLYAPFAVLAMFGLHWLASIGGRFGRPAACGLLAAGVIATVIEMANIHPHQNVYFNVLVDRRTPGHLRSQYDMDYWRTSIREALELLTERVPTGPIYVRSERHEPLSRNLSILPRDDRERVVLSRERAGYYIATNPMDLQYYQGWPIGLFPPPIWQRTVYSSAIATVAALDLSKVDAATADRYRDAYRRTTAGVPLIEAEYDVYLDDLDEGRLFYAKHPCTPLDMADGFVLDLTPASGADLPGSFRLLGFTPTHPFYAVLVDDKCMASVRLPPYAAAHIGVGQYEEATFGSRRVAWARGQAFNSGSAGDDAGASWRNWTDYWKGGTEWQEWVDEQAPIDAYDVIVAQGRLLYKKSDCTLGEQHASFFLHVYPRRTEDLPRHRRQLGFDRLVFSLSSHGGRLPRSRCTASVPLPDYDIKTISTGQWTARRGNIWQVEIVP